MDYALKNQHKTVDFWNEILFTDESKYSIYKCDRRGKVWRKANEELKPKNMTSTVKHGSGSVMVWVVWSSMAATDVRNLHFIEGIMDHIKYIKIQGAAKKKTMKAVRNKHFISWKFKKQTTNNDNVASQPGG